MVQPKMKVKVDFNKKLLRNAVREATVAPLDKAAALVEREAKQSMKAGGGRARAPSNAPEPPNVQTGNLRASIQWAVDGNKRVIGPTTTAPYGRIHEFGALQSGGRIPPRPYMRPALQRVQRRFVSLFKSLKLATTKSGRRLNRKKGKK